MPKRRCRSFNPQFKAQVVLEVLSGKHERSPLSVSSALRHLQNLVSARPWPSAASPRAPSALRMQRRRTKPLRGGPTAPSPMEFEWPDRGPLVSSRGSPGPADRCPGRRFYVAGRSYQVVAKGVPVLPLKGGRSWFGL